MFLLFSFDFFFSLFFLSFLLTTRLTINTLQHSLPTPSLPKQDTDPHSVFTKARLAYCCGNIFQTEGLLGSYLSVFLVDVVGLRPSLVGTLLLIKQVSLFCFVLFFQFSLSLPLFLSFLFSLFLSSFFLFFSVKTRYLILFFLKSSQSFLLFFLLDLGCHYRPNRGGYV